MNKKLLMAAIGAALAAGPMMAAQAAPTVYGHLHLSLDNYKVDNATGASSSTTQRSLLNSNSSRFGLKGDEDFGGGLKGIWQVESGVFSATDGSGGFGSPLRNTFVGFAGSWGTAKFGRHDTPMKDMGRMVDLFNEQIGDARTVVGNNNGTVNGVNTGQSFDNRISNMVRYESPNMGGVKANLSYGMPECNTTASVANSNCSGNGTRTTSGDVLWSGGPVTAGLGYEKDNTGGVTNTPKIMRLIGKYSMADLTFNALYEKQKDITGNLPAGKSGDDRTAWSVGAGYKIANNMLKFQYSKANKSDQAATVAGSNDNSGKVWALGVDHSLSKSTLVYFAYAKAENGQGTNAYNVSNNLGGHDTTNVPNVGKLGGSSKSYSFGTIMNF